jgi:hypothetical protein
MTRAGVAGIFRLLRTGAGQNVAHPTTFKMLSIQESMEVVGSEGDHVGTVHHKERDRLIIKW